MIAIWLAKDRVNFGVQTCEELNTRTLKKRNMTANSVPKFPLGKVVATPGALAALAEAGQTPIQFLSRHVNGDWGDCDGEDRQANEDALRHGDRLLSVYQTPKGKRIWVITEADRSSTCVLLPEEY